MVAPGRGIETVRFPYRPSEPVFRCRGQPSIGSIVSIARPANLCNFSRTEDIGLCLHCKYRNQRESPLWVPQIGFEEEAVGTSTGTVTTRLC
jgi:hypothetical protein